MFSSATASSSLPPSLLGEYVNLVTVIFFFRLLSSSLGLLLLLMMISE